MFRHTGEPWIAYAGSDGETRSILAADRDHHSPIVHWMGFDECRNARFDMPRIVACVNACAGIPNRALRLDGLYDALGALAQTATFLAQNLEGEDERAQPWCRILTTTRRLLRRYGHRI